MQFHVSYLTSHSDNNQDPIILINLSTLSHHYRSDLKDKLIGRRLNQIQKEFESFLKNLRDNGAELMFVFKKSQCNEKDSGRNTENAYNAGCEILDMVSRLRSTDAVVQHFKEKIEAERKGFRKDKFEPPYNQALNMVLAQTAQRYGKLHGMETADCKRITAHVQLANKHRVMAIIGTDASYTFYEGAWKFWTDYKLNMTSMKIQELNKEKILQLMGITFTQAPLFVALAGGLRSTEENGEKIFRYFSERRKSTADNYNFKLRQPPTASISSHRSSFGIDCGRNLRPT